MRDVIVLRQWEASRLKEKLPLYTRVGRIVHYTGTWESIQLAWAAKDLHDASKFPYIHDTTLPQHRLNEALPEPLQDEYPVWYFLTGPIAKPRKLQTLLKLDIEPYKRCAVVHGLTTLHHRQFEVTVESDTDEAYPTLGPSVGAAYIIRSKEAEDRLRYFKTDHFMLVRCKITLCPIHEFGQAHEVDGLTFVIDQETPLFHSLRSIPLDQMSNSTSTEPSLPFEGYDYVRLEGAEEGHEAIDRNIATFAFPFLRDGRECNARDVISRRTLLKSPHRPRSPLTGMNINFDAPSTSGSTSMNVGEDMMARRIRMEHIIGNNLRWSVPRVGVLATTSRRSVLATTSGFDLPLGISTSTRLMESAGAVEHIEDIGRLWIGDGTDSMPLAVSTKEPEDIRRPEGTGRGKVE
ncbi:hypothetical protein DE146DRAFT_652550 [Phaeosphaeria sp. MPI-PUGE-AT-0046c]|nr:hypothetical protein DE146DRAFT_652550 [Phaeosphaeria sp. MPI-PUGE-AT-0046c]